MNLPSPEPGSVVEAGAHEAAAALARLLRVPVHAENFTSLDVGQLAASHGASSGEGRVVVIAFDASGGVKGTFALVVDDAVAAWLASRLTGAVTLDGAIGKGALAALAEFGNIAASAFLNGAARVVGRTCLPSVPRVTHAATKEALLSLPASLPSSSMSVATLRLQQQWFSLVFSPATTT